MALSIRLGAFSGRLLLFKLPEKRRQVKVFLEILTVCFKLFFMVVILCFSFLSADFQMNISEFDFNNEDGVES
jgi:preprotein translocase subunit SecG